jgi:hypothetical protein
MQKLLKQKTSGFIYVWTAFLAARDDMELYEPPPKEVAAAPEKPVTKTENTSQNPEQASANDKPEDDLSSAMTAFRRQVSKAGRKPSTKSSEQA